MTLKELKPGASARIEDIQGQGSMKRRMIDMGLTPGVRITMVRAAPLGDPVVLRVRGYELTLRKKDAEQIIISAIKP